MGKSSREILISALLPYEKKRRGEKFTWQMQ